MSFFRRSVFAIQYEIVSDGINRKLKVVAAFFLCWLFAPGVGISALRHHRACHLCCMWAAFMMEIISTVPHSMHIIRSTHNKFIYFGEFFVFFFIIVSKYLKLVTLPTRIGSTFIQLNDRPRKNYIGRGEKSHITNDIYKTDI